MSSIPKAWVVRGGDGSERVFEDYAISNNCAIIGWFLPDLTGIPNSEKEARRELKSLYRSAYPEVENNHTIDQSVGSILRFLQIRRDDFVVMPMENQVAIGKADGSYRYERHFEAPEKWDKGWGQHRIPVVWHKPTFPYEIFEENLRNSLRLGQLTVYLIGGKEKNASYARRIQAILETSLDPGFKWDSIKNQSQGGVPYRETIPQEIVEKQEVWEVDPDLKDRGTEAHKSVQSELAEAVRSAGLEPQSPDPSIPDPEFDVAWRRNDTAFVAEVKSLTEDNEVRQLRLGLGQVLNYAHLLNWSGVETVQAVLAVEYRPATEYWVDLCEEHGVILTWPEKFHEIFD